MLQCLRHIYQYVHAANKDVHGLLAKENKVGLTQRHRQLSAAARPLDDLKQAFNPHDTAASKFDTLHFTHSLRSLLCACAKPLPMRLYTRHT
jgi:hypothetical protein